MCPPHQLNPPVPSATPTGWTGAGPSKWEVEVEVAVLSPVMLGNSKMPYTGPLSVAFEYDITNTCNLDAQDILDYAKVM